MQRNEVLGAVAFLAAVLVAVPDPEGFDNGSAGGGVTFTLLGEYGRLGNQLFQIMAVKYYAAKLGVPAILPESTRSLSLFGLVNLDDFVIRDLEPDRIVSEKTAMSPPLIDVPGNASLDLRGYFQNRAFISRVPPLLPEIRAKGARFAGYVGVHVRRGDYLLYPEFQSLSSEYYARALDAIADSQACKVVVCSDDIPWCKANLRFPPRFRTEFSHRVNDVDDFAVLAGCSALVMSNSSYSWWAAQYNKKRVVMPWPWFTTENPDITPDALRCPGWTVMPA
jgi:hypothetical protein